MKTKNILYAFLTCAFILGTLTINAQTKVYVHKKNGTADVYNIADLDSINFTPPAEINYSNLVINEVNGVSGQKWVEIYNKGEVDIPLDGITIQYSNSNGSSFSTQWTFDASDIITAKGYYSNSSALASLSANNGNVVVTINMPSPSNQVIDTYTKQIDINDGYSVIKNVAHARIPDGTGDWYYLAGNSAGSKNATNGTGTFGYVQFGNEISAADGYTPGVDYSQLVINEVDGNGKFVEIYNKGTQPVPLIGVKLIKNESAIWWTGGASASIAAGGFYTIAQSGGAAGATEYTGNGGISSQQNLKFELQEPENNTSIDTFLRTNGSLLGYTVTPNYSKDSAAGGGGIYSFSRCPDGTGDFKLAVPSCNASNNSSEGDIITNP